MFGERNVDLKTHRYFDPWKNAARYLNNSVNSDAYYHRIKLNYL